LPLLQKIAKGKKITFMVDLYDHAALLNGLAKDLGVQAGLCVDVDMSLSLPGIHLGAWRSSLSSKEQVLAFAKKLADLPFVKIEGLMGYEAQIAGVPDRIKGRSFKNLLVRIIKLLSRPEVARRRKESMEALGVVMPFFYNGKESLTLGDPVFFRHAKAGELLEHFNTLYLIQEGEVLEELPTYRGEGKVFL
jgi:D-serine deaminase-like pyridoxal phosphate-dependent protein